MRIQSGEEGLPLLSGLFIRPSLPSSRSRTTIRSGHDIIESLSLSPRNYGCFKEWNAITPVVLRNSQRSIEA